MPRLSDRAIKSLPIPDQGQTELWDSVVPGLGVRAGYGGRKAFVLMYRVRGNPKKRRMTLGRYPATTLADARNLAREAVLLSQRGVDPAVSGRTAETDQLVYSDLVDAFITKYRDADRRRSWREVERIIQRETVGRWVNRKAADITREDVQGLLDAVVKRGSPIAANRLLAALRPMFRWAVESGRLQSSPVDGMRNPVSEKGRAKDNVVGDAELHRLWGAWDQMGYPFGTFFKAALLTGQRRGEVAGMKWSDIDLENQTWNLSADQTKAGRTHDVPLSRQMMDLLGTIPRLEDNPHVFAARGNKSAAISGFSKAVRRARELSGIEDWTIHDLRRTATSGLAKLGFELPVLAAVLNHSPGQVMGITAVYNRYAYADEKRLALQAWADHVMGHGIHNETA